MKKVTDILSIHRVPIAAEVWSLRKEFGLEIKLWMKGKASFSIAFWIWALLVISPKQQKLINRREL